MKKLSFEVEVDSGMVAIITINLNDKRLLPKEIYEIFQK